MLYASHRVVGVMELETIRSVGESNSFRTSYAPVTHANLAAIRRIEFELTDSRMTPKAACEPAVKFDAARLRRELDAALENLLANSASVDLS